MKRGKVFILLGVFLLLICVIIIPVLGVVKVIHWAGEAADNQFLVPGKGVFAVEEPGRYYLWNDHITIYEGVSYNSSLTIPNGVAIEIRNEQGDVFDLKQSMNTSVSKGSGSSQSIGYVDLEHPQTLTIEVSNLSEQRVFSFGRFDFFKIFGWIFAAVAFCIGGSFVGLVLFVIGIVKRTKKQQPEPSPTA